MRKTKTPQKEDLENVSNRDNYQTPNYATDLLVPFIKNLLTLYPDRKSRIWECAAGQGKMVRRLQDWGFDVIASDLQGTPSVNFLKDEPPSAFFGCIITNPPYSLKKKFYLRCREYQVPFALLIPADYSGWIINAVEQHGCEKIVPTRRIDYITPNILQRIHEGEIFERIPEDVKKDFNLAQFKDSFPATWGKYLLKFQNYNNFPSIYDVPFQFLRKYSSSNFHSMWLTWGFNIGRTETFVELTNEMKNNI